MLNEQPEHQLDPEALNSERLLAGATYTLDLDRKSARSSDGENSSGATGALH